MYGEHRILDCKHEHMMKNGAPPGNVGILHCFLPTELLDFNSVIDVDGLYHTLVSGNISMF